MTDTPQTLLPLTYPWPGVSDIYSWGSFALRSIRQFWEPSIRSPAGVRVTYGKAWTLSKSRQ
jgi:hypothetical protein